MGGSKHHQKKKKSKEGHEAETAKDEKMDEKNEAEAESAEDAEHEDGPRKRPAQADKAACKKSAKQGHPARAATMQHSELDDDIPPRLHAD